jgi:triacylglycerol lipase
MSVAPPPDPPTDPPFIPNEQLEELGPELPPVMILHGLGVHPWIMSVVAYRLRKSGRRAHLIGYNSYHTTIPQIAQIVARKIRRFGYEEIDVVAHSMGGIILRYAYNHAHLPRVRRAVTIGSPHRGSSLANYVSTKLSRLSRLVLGEILLQMRHGDLGLAARAGTLDGVEVGVIAGGNKTKNGMNRLIKGDNDGIIAVEETPLLGMKDFIHVSQGHTFQLFNKRVMEYAIHFLDHGRFRKRVPTPHHGDDED